MDESPPAALFLLSGAQEHDPAVEAYLAKQAGELGELARHWFEIVRGCGEDVCELLHDGHPTACVWNAAFAYVAVFRAHVNVGFFHGADLPDPAGLLEGSGRRMRHVKLRAGRTTNAEALNELIRRAYADVKRRAL